MSAKNQKDANYSSMNQTLADDKYLTFWIDKQLFGFPALDVAQIVGMQQITPIPEFPQYAKGIINLRGEIIPVIDMRLRLHRSEADYNERTCIIVTSINNNLIGLIVDTVEEVSEITKNQISPPPKLSNEITNVFLTGVAQLQDKIILLVDTEKILTKDELAVVLKTSEGESKEC